MSFRLELAPAARGAYYALPSGLFQRVREELEVLVELAALVLPPGREEPSRAARAALPGVMDLDEVVLHYALDWQARVLRLERVARQAPAQTG